MATARISIYDRVAQRSGPLIATAEPQLDSTHAPWTGIKLEHYRLGCSDRPESTLSSYLVAVCLSGSYATEYAPGFGQRGFTIVYQPETLFLAGPGDLPARHSKGEIEFLALDLAPEVVLWAAEELVVNGSFEIQRLWAAKDDQLRYIVLTLYEELLANCPAGRLFGEYMGLSFATALLTSHASARTRLAGYRGGLSPCKLRQVTAFIADNLSSTLSLAEMANLLQMGPCHFARAFKESTGLSPHQYVLRRRIERALQMIKETSTSLVDIAYDVGFCSQGHFTTVFSKIVGVSPSNYREQVHPARMRLCYSPTETANEFSTARHEA